MTEHATRAHARFGASSAHRWFACPGSVALTAGMPDEPSAAALEGTRAHELLEALLRNSLGTVITSDREFWLGQATTLWDAAPQDMRDAVHVAVDHVKELVEDHPDAVVLVEHRFEIPVAAAPGEVFGTCDCVVFLPSLRTLHVVDYKHGAGVFVPAEGNEQLRFYGLGALANIDVALAPRLGAVGAIDTVCLTIVQPRCAVGDPVREEWLPVEDLLEFGPVIGAAVARCKRVIWSERGGVWADSETGEAALVPGEEQCRFCAARAACPAREALAASSFDGVTDVARVDPRALQAPPTMPTARLADIMNARAGIVAWLDDLEAETERRLRAGEDVPGWKLVEAQARRQWNSEDIDATAYELARVKHQMDATPSEAAEFKVEKLRGLGEVEAILKAGCDRAEARRRLDAMAYLTTKKSSGALKVVPEKDPRPPAALGSAFDEVVHVEDKR